MKTLLLFLILIFIYQTVNAKSSHKKLKHQNVIFQRYLQCDDDYKGIYSWSFRPKGQYIFFKLF